MIKYSGRAALDLYLSDLGGREGRDLSLQPLGHAQRPVFEQRRPLTPDQAATPRVIHELP
jgi:hypothetical protein